MDRSALITTDVVVIGAGPVGENVADRVTKGGLSAVIVEQHLVGGECSYYACIPSKALIRPGSALEAARRVQGAKDAVSGQLDALEVLARRSWFTGDLNDEGQVSWLDGAGIQLVRGSGRITGTRTVAVSNPDGEVTIEARQAVVIATGSRAMLPPIDGIADVDVWTNREATSASSIPESLIVVGGGVSAAELGQAFARLGSRVTILARHDLLGMYPARARDLVAAGLERDGIELRRDTSPARVSQDSTGTKHVTLEDGTDLRADALFFSTGRTKNIDDIGLDTIGVDPNGLSTGDDGRVAGVDGGWLYAVGDAAGKVLLTHQGKYEARATGDIIVARAAGKVTGEAEPWSRFAASADHIAVPQVVFTDPEIAMVGRSAEQAERDGIRTRVVERAIDVSGASLLADGYEGWAQMVVDEDRSVIVGMTLVGQDVAELIHAATIAIVGEVPLARLWHAVPAFPTMSEIWLRLLEDYGL
jgi:dihydrolipoamide dehydrogenase